MNYTSTMQFIELFRQHRALWDRHDVNYLNKAERMRQREQIGFAMGMTEVDVGKKICNLRTYYLREMVKRDKALEYGQETEESYIPKWPYFDALDSFLQDVVRKKRNEYLTAGGPFQELPYMYTVDDHLSDNDVTEDFPANDSNDLSRDSGHPGGEGEAKRSFYITTNDANDSDPDLPPPKRPKLEPEEDYPDGEDGNTAEKEPRGGAGNSDTPGSCLEAGVPGHRTSSFRALSSILPASLGAQPGPSLHRLPTTRGPVSSQGLGTSSPNLALGMEGPRMNGHGVGGTPPGPYPGNSPRVPMMVEEDEDWLFGRYIAAELKKVKSFKDKQLTKMKIQQIVTYAQLGIGEQGSASSSSANAAADV